MNSPHESQPLAAAVVICTYNRCASLAHTLDSLAAMHVPSQVRLSLLVVDNNSTDQTAEVVRRFRDKLPIRYCFEPQQGLSRARNRGVRETNDDVIIFTDDDVRVVPEWLTSYAESIVQFPRASFFGGPIEPWWPNGRPGWLVNDKLDLIQGLFGCYNEGTVSKYFAEHDSRPCGANMAYKRDVFQRAGFFRTDLGVRGGDMGRGEETEFIQRLERAGVQGCYVAQALCFHEFDLRRTRLREAFRYGIASGICAARTNATSSAGLYGYIRAAVYCLRGLRQQLLGRGDRFRQCVIRAGIEVGRRRETLRLAKDAKCSRVVDSEVSS